MRGEDITPSFCRLFIRRAAPCPRDTAVLLRFTASPGAGLEFHVLIPSCIYSSISVTNTLLTLNLILSTLIETSDWSPDGNCLNVITSSLSASSGTCMTLKKFNQSREWNRQSMELGLIDGSSRKACLIRKVNLQCGECTLLSSLCGVVLEAKSYRIWISKDYVACQNYGTLGWNFHGAHQKKSFDDKKELCRKLVNHQGSLFL